MRFISIALALSLSLMFSLSLKAQENEMFKNPGCMCCDKWAEHMIDNGFDIKITVKIEEVPAIILDFFPSDSPARNSGKAEKLAKIIPSRDPY